MSNIKYIRNIIEGNWEGIKTSIKDNWEKLTDEDINHINGSYNTLSEKLKIHYGYNDMEMQSDIIDFLDASEKIKRIHKRKIGEIKNAAFNRMARYFNVIKERSSDGKKTVLNYVFKGPCKNIRISPESEVLTGCLFFRDETG